MVQKFDHLFFYQVFFCKIQKEFIKMATITKQTNATKEKENAQKMALDKYKAELKAVSDIFCKARIKADAIRFIDAGGTKEKALDMALEACKKELAACKKEIAAKQAEIEKIVAETNRYKAIREEKKKAGINNNSNLNPVQKFAFTLGVAAMKKELDNNKNSVAVSRKDLETIEKMDIKECLAIIEEHQRRSYKSSFGENLEPQISKPSNYKNLDQAHQMEIQEEQKEFFGL